MNIHSLATSLPSFVSYKMMGNDYKSHTKIMSKNNK